MREIKFRAKGKDNGDWVYGDYCSIPNPNILFINSDNEIDTEEIDPKTVGQFTGLHDKNGKEIYEGDILEFITKRKYGFLYDGVKVRIKVEFGKFNPMNDTLYDFIGFHTNDSSIQYYLEYGCEVVGNVHDNPELLK